MFSFDNKKHNIKSGQFSELVLSSRIDENDNNNVFDIINETRKYPN